MQKTSKKIDEYTVEITKELPVAELSVVKYERSFIEQQIIDITKQRDDLIALKEAELLECQNILTEMNKLGIITKVEVTPKEELPVEKIII